MKAGDGARTRDLRLGKPTLYQLSYTRKRSPKLPERPRSRCRPGNVAQGSLRLHPFGRLHSEQFQTDCKHRPGCLGEI